MKNIINIPHSVCKYTCMVNGIGDVYRFKTGQSFSDEFLMAASGMAGFAYIKNKQAEPPFMVFWGQSIKNQYKNLEHILGLKIKISEGKSFNFSLKLLKEEVNKRNPVVIGPLDMFYLEYHPFFKKNHAFPHFVLVVGYDDNDGKIFLYDCDLPDLQRLDYKNLKTAWEKDAPGYLKKNTVISFLVPDNPLSFEESVKTGLLAKADQMLNPPITNLGIPGIRKLASEFADWEKFLGKDDYRHSLESIAKFANSPPTLSMDYNDFTGKRKDLSRLLQELASAIDEKSLINISENFSTSGKLIREVSLIILEWLEGKSDRRKFIPQLLMKIADIEEEAYGAIRGIYNK
jgi:hypothetical protein